MKESTAAKLNLRVFLKKKVSGGVLLMALLLWLGFITAKENHLNPHFFRNGKIPSFRFFFFMSYEGLGLMCCWFCSGKAAAVVPGLGGFC